jgi:hypothetical protein
MGSSALMSLATVGGLTLRYRAQASRLSNSLPVPTIRTGILPSFFSSLASLDTHLPLFASCVVSYTHFCVRLRPYEHQTVSVSPNRSPNYPHLVSVSQLRSSPATTARPDSPSGTAHLWSGAPPSTLAAPVRTLRSDIEEQYEPPTVGCRSSSLL